MKKLLFIIINLLIINPLVFAQSITIVPSGSASKGMLELSSTTNGFLPPRMKAIEKDAILTPAEGLIVYQTDIMPGLYVYNGRMWVLLGGWSLTGNAGTNAATHFIGTTDTTDVIFRRNNVRAGRISNVNTSFGVEALNPANTGKGNSAFGSFSLLSNSTGGLNTAVGDNTLFLNTTGSYNTATGYKASYNNTSGNKNTSYGSSALLSNQSGNENVAIGNEAMLYTNTGKENVAVGSGALFNNTLGSFNTALGDNALIKNKEGYYNTAIGAFADVDSENLTNATAIGSYAKVSSSNSLILGNNDVSVGIGVTAPEAKLHVNPDYKGGILIGKDKSSGNYTNLEIGVSNRIAGSGYIQAIQETSNWAKNNLLLNPAGGYVGINIPETAFATSPLDIQQTSETRGLNLQFKNYDWNLHVLDNHNLGFSHQGAAKSWVDWWDGTWNTASDRRLKKNINQMGHILDKVMALQPKTYQYINNESDNKANKIVAGFIAQDVMPLFPELVSDFKLDEKDPNTTYHGLNYSGFGVIAIKAIQEQQQEIQEQKQEIEVLKGQLKIVLEEIERLKKK